MARLRSIRRLLLRFGQVDNRRRALLVEAVAYLFAARLALIFIPFPRLARQLGTFVPPTDARASQARSAIAPDQAQLAEAIGWAVTRAARYVPFKAVCLPQAMAARVMLKRRGITSVMHFGAAKGTDKAARRPRLARRRRRRGDGLSGGGEFRRDRVFCVRGFG